MSNEVLLDPMPRVAAQRTKLAEVPPEKKATMVMRTIVGLFIAATGVFARRFWPTLPDLVAFGTFGLGMVTVSGQLISHPFKLFVAMLRDLLDVIRGKTRDPDTGATIPPGTP